ncbi:macrosialin-like [Xyrauchen texanus]|uniref:macrosialin-like n=1 Tax=Xyrauchen texanus TaxID=154827 RepID=UPI002241AE5E|nr:macrosialin-like [Xyrauchen texanus]
MRNGLLLMIALFIAATALTSGQYGANSKPSDVKSSTAHSNSSATTVPAPNITTVNPNMKTTPHVTTGPAPNTTTVNPNMTTTPHVTTGPAPNTTTVNPNMTTTPHVTTGPAPNTTTVNPNMTTTPHVTTGPAPNTTTVNPNTTTTPNVTTGPAPNTTTVNPNTTTTPNVTTAPAPNTTTAAPTSAPVPTPSTNLTVGNYNISDKSGNLCFLAHMAIEIRVNTSQVNGRFIVQPHQTSASGNCGEKIFLNFKQGKIALQFRNNATSKMVYVETLEYNLTYAFKSGVASSFRGKNESLWLFAAAAGHSYSCKAETVNMGSGVYLDLSSYRIQAYNFKSNNFGTADLCKADQTDYRVPIAVGIILIILIVIVVLAYLISRKRRTDGYQSL